MTMSDPLNPYQAWLGIPPEECDDGQPHHYQLLGLRVFEKDPQAIDAAARRTIATLSAFATGPYQSLAERLMLEAGAAAACLGDPEQKAEHDRALALGLPLVSATKLSQANSVAQSSPVITGGAFPDAAAVEYVHQLVQTSVGEAESEYALDAVVEPAPLAPVAADAEMLPSAGRRMRRQMVDLSTIMVLLGGVVGLLRGYFIVYYLLGEDLLRLLPPREGLMRLPN